MLSIKSIKSTVTSRHSCKKVVALAALAATVVGCAPTPPNVNYTYIKADSTLAKASDINAQSQLVDAASSVSHSLQELSSIQQATHPDVSIASYKTFNQIGLNHVASLNWTGPVVPALKTIAKTVGYKLNIIGNKPTMPALVNVAQNNQQIATILRNINYQLTINNSGSIILYPASKVLELRYPAQ